LGSLNLIITKLLDFSFYVPYVKVPENIVDSSFSWAGVSVDRDNKLKENLENPLGFISS
jgi:hypothetical protein